MLLTPKKLLKFLKLLFCKPQKIFKLSFKRGNFLQEPTSKVWCLMELNEVSFFFPKKQLTVIMYFIHDHL